MKEIKAREKIYLEDYDIYVTPYLSYEQIEKIIYNMHTQQNYTDRLKIRDLMVLAYCTDIGNEKIDEIGHEVLYSSGLVDKVLSLVENEYLVTAGLRWGESIEHAISEISKKMPDFLDKYKKVIEFANSKK